MSGKCPYVFGEGEKAGSVCGVPCECVCKGCPEHTNEIKESLENPENLLEMPGLFKFWKVHGTAMSVEDATKLVASEIAETFSYTRSYIKEFSEAYGTPSSNLGRVGFSRDSVVSRAVTLQGWKKSAQVV